MALVRRLALSRGSTLIGGEWGRIVWDGIFFSIFVVWRVGKGLGAGSCLG